jgi:anti-sigma regulatory factor (Ser/Thr protein kinase)
MLIPATDPTCATGLNGEPVAHAAIDLTGLTAPQRASRAIVRDALSGRASQEWVEDVILAADELVGNAYRLVGVEGTMGIALDLYVWGATVRVNDSGADARAVPSRPLMPAEDAECGRGLFLVDNLASTWGVQPTGAGKSVIAIFLHQVAGESR